jgi:hypothetical protein
VDADGDGSTAGADCDDTDATVSPDADEVCDGLDNDCDGDVDDDPSDGATFYADADGDGYGDAAGAATGCEPPAGSVTDAADCDDTRADVHPDATETDCADPTDYNCDGSTTYADADGDGFAACEDCDDADAARNPGMAEVCDAADVDEDCNGSADDDDPGVTAVPSWYRDADGDGYSVGTGAQLVQCEAPTGYSDVAGDCDDYDLDINPAAAEVCDAADVDEDCDGVADDADPSTDAATWTAFYADRDADGYGDPARLVSQCELPAAYVTDASDCDDGNAAISPVATELCDTADVDEDCNGLADDADTAVDGKSTFYQDGDGDGYAGTTTTAACDEPAGYYPTAEDCDDGSAAISPAGSEVCDAANADEDCDGLVDDADGSATGESTWYRDGDADGYGGTTTFAACDQPSGYVADATDCDDTSAAANPGGSEICDAADSDEDCDGGADDADASATGQATLYRDADGDTFGNPAVTTTACDSVLGYVTNGSDCDDTSAAVIAYTWYRDVDGDGYGGSTTTTACTAPTGYLSTGGDCDDGTAAVRPGATEVCDASNLDEDCDGNADDLDTSASGKTSWYLDADGDGYGISTTSVSRCDQPSGYAVPSTDCDDAVSGAHPGGTEVCGDGVDQDCVGGDETCPTGFSGTYALSSADTIIYGSNASDELGISLVAGDFDGDGYGDLVVGADNGEYGGYTGYGTVYGYYGPFIAGTQADVAHDDFSIYNTSSTYAGYWGERSYNIGDLTGDGKDDLLVATSATTSYVFYGGDMSAVANSGYDLGRNCSSAAPAGDFNATTGTDEFVCGQYNVSSTAGAAYIYSGTSSTVVATLTGETSGDYAGYAVAGGGDVDGDGYDDVWVGATYNDNPYHSGGAVYLVYGPETGTRALASADAVIRGETAYTYIGWSMSMPGDVDGDGHDDVLAGGIGYGTHAGAVYVYTSVTTGAYTSAGADAVIHGEDAEDKITEHDNALSSGDVNGDGDVDVLVGSYYNDDGGSGAGGAWLVLGPLAGTIELATDADADWVGASAGDLLGYSTVIVPDTDGDGKDEVALGAPDGDAGGTDHGAVWIWLGE